MVTPISGPFVNKSYSKTCFISKQIKGEPGKDGTNGQDGAPGTNGTDGNSIEAQYVFC
jgi:hypothetical protein